jgi:hypothetical protein
MAGRQTRFSYVERQSRMGPVKSALLIALGVAAVVAQFFK